MASSSQQEQQQQKQQQQKHQQQQHKQRWRSSVAIHNLAGTRTSCDQRTRHEDQGLNLSSFISSITSSDLVFKTEALHRLSLFLLYLSPTFETSFSCPDAFTISFVFRSEEILVPVKDIEVLYRVLFSDLASYTDWLFRQKSFKLEQGYKICSDSTDSLCDGVHLMLLVEVLRCCIRTLPLLEFNTSLSLVAAEILTSVFKQLYCPTSLGTLISQSFRDVNYCRNEVHFHEFSGNTYGSSDSPLSYASLVEATMKDLEEHFFDHKNTEAFSLNLLGKNTMSCCIHNAMRQTDRTQIVCALLEVFMDELLLEPGLADVLLASNPDAEIELSSDGFSCTKYAQMTMEAAAAHFILSVSQSNYIEILQGNFYATHSACLGLGISLPAAVMLLDLVVADRMCVPEVFFSHIINILIRTFSNSSCLIPELPGGIILGLAGSALETAVNIYFRICSLPIVYNEFSSVCDRFQALHAGDISVSSVLKILFDEESHSEAEQPIIDFCYVSNVSTYEDIELERSLHGQSACYNTRQGPAYNNFEEQNQIFHILDCSSHTQSSCVESNRTALVSVLRLISSSVLYIVTEANKEDLRSKQTETPERNTQGASTSVDAETYIDYAKEAFKICISNNVEETWKNLKLDLHMQKLFSRADEVMKNVFTFFLDKLHWSLKQNAPKALCQAYSDVLKSLVTLTVFVDQRRNKEHPPDNTIPHQNLHCMEHMSGEILDKDWQGTGEFLDMTKDKNLENNTLVKMDKPFSDQIYQSGELMSSTLIMTRRYQRRRQYIISRTESRRQEEANVSARRLGQESGITKGRKSSLQNEIISNDGNPYIEEMLAREGKLDGECFDDLNDFIVCKSGRDYSLWMKSHIRKRKKKLQKTYWQRLKARKALVSLLTSKGQHVTF